MPWSWPNHEVGAGGNDFQIAGAGVRPALGLNQAPAGLPLSMFHEYSQVVIDFVRQNHWWALPVVFALAFGESRGVI